MNYVQAASDHIAELYPLVVYAQPRLMDLPAGAIIGTWSYSVPGKVRYVLDRSREIAPGVLPGDLARAWIRDQYKLPFKRRKTQLERSHSVPLHARVGSWGDCSYVDIRGAYLRILELGYDVEYILGRYIGAMPAPIPPEIEASKFTYSIAVAMSGTARSKLEVMGKDKGGDLGATIFKHTPINLYSNPCLYNLAQDTLNGIGAEMLAVMRDKCVYANTDGYIVRAGYEKYALDIIASWGFVGAVKHQGNTEVRGVASWKIGNEQTKRFDHSAADFTGALMDRDSRRWLKARWSKWTTKLATISKTQE